MRVHVFSSMLYIWALTHTKVPSIPMSPCTALQPKHQGVIGKRLDILFQLDGDIITSSSPKPHVIANISLDYCERNANWARLFHCHHSNVKCDSGTVYDTRVIHRETKLQFDTFSNSLG